MRVMMFGAIGLVSLITAGCLPEQSGPAGVGGAKVNNSPTTHEGRMTAQQVSDQQVIATVRSLIQTEDAFTLSELRTSPDSSAGVVRTSSGDWQFRFDLHGGTFDLAYLRAQSTKPAPGEAIDIAAALSKGRAISQQLYPTWKAGHMHEVLAHDVRKNIHGASPPMGTRYVMAWEEQLDNLYRSQSSVFIAMSEQGQVLQYRAKLAPQPLVYPEVAEAAARATAKAAIEDHAKANSIDSYELDEFYCQLGGPQQAPVWYARFLCAKAGPKGSQRVHFGVTVAVNGLDGTVRLT